MKQAKVSSSEEFKRVMAICDTMQNGKRNRLMLMLSHYAGMRVGEIAWEYPKLCVWGLAHAVETGHLLNRYRPNRPARRGADQDPPAPGSGSDDTMAGGRHIC